MAISGRSFQKVVAGARTPQEVTINNFGGVDLSSPTFQINSSRAASSINFLKKDGINQKRDAIHNVLNFPSTSSDSIRGVFSFTDSTNTKRVVMVARAPNAAINVLTIYLVTGLGFGKNYRDASDTFTPVKNSNNVLVTYSTTEKFVSGWVVGDRLYLLFPGNNYVVVYYNDSAVGGAKVVVDPLPNNLDLTYIPLTRFGSSAVGTGVAFEAGIAYDDLNMLTQWKKNNFRTGLFSNVSTENPYHASSFFRYNLDSKVVAKVQTDYNLMKLKLSYLKNTADTGLSTDNWTTNATQIIYGQDITLVDQYKKAAYTTSGTGREFRTSDLLFRVLFDRVIGNNLVINNGSYYVNAQSIDNFSYNGIETAVFYDLNAYPLNTYPYPIQASSGSFAPKVVLDLRQAVADGYLNHHQALAFSHHLFYVLKGDFGGFNFNLSAQVLTQPTGQAPTIPEIVNQTCRVTVISPTEYSAYEVKQELLLSPSSSTSTSAVFSAPVNGVSRVVANVFYGGKDENGYIQIPYNSSGNPISFLGASSLTDFYSPIVGFSNMELLFPYHVDGYEKRITNNKFGKLFGYNGAKNRLFLGGNPEFKNVLYHTYNTNFYTQGQGEIIPSSNDLTYFSDLEYNIVGSEDNAITGLEVLADSRLLVLKKDNKEDSTVHTIVATTTKATAYDGSSVTALDGTDLQEELYLADTGSISDGLEHHWLLTTINGDTVFLGKQGIRGIVPERNLPTAPRKSVVRSSVIDKVLRENYNKVYNAAMTVFDGKLYLFLDGVLYVADEDYRFQGAEDFEYEFWTLKSSEITVNNVKDFKNLEIKNFFEFDGELYFYNYGNEQIQNSTTNFFQNRIYKFVANSYVDKDVISFGNGNITFQDDYPIDDQTLIFDAVGSPNVMSYILLGDLQKTTVSFKNSMYHFLGEVTLFGDTTLNFGNLSRIESLKTEELYDNRKVIVTYGGSASLGKIFYLSLGGNQPTSSLRQLKDESGNIVANFANFFHPTTGKMSIAAVIEPGTEMKIPYAISEFGGRFTLLTEFDVIARLTSVQGVALDRSFYVIKNENITAQYVTAPFNFGSISDIKTITKFVISNDTRQDSYLEIEYLASNDTDLFKKITDTNSQLDLSNLSFNNIYFGSVNLPLPFSIRTNTRNVQSIMFKFYNNQESNAILTNLTMLYYITRKVR